MATAVDTSTTRAYTLRLSGGNNWRELLWQTHVAVNRGAWVWGDWLLTLRGGLPASLADGDAERRVVLALSWLSVESPASLAPQAHIVAYGSDARDERNRKVTERFRDILRRMGIKQQQEQEWLDACLPALMASIREDAVWVDRSACFAEAQQCYRGLSSEWARKTLFDFLGGEDDYFKPSAKEGASSKAKDFVQKAGRWLSRHWGAGKKSDPRDISTRLGKLAGVDPKAIDGHTGRAALEDLLRTLGSRPAQNADAEKLYRQLKRAVGWKGRPSKGAVALKKIRDAERVPNDLWKEIASTLREEAAVQSSQTSDHAAVPDWRSHWPAEITGLPMPYRVDRDYIWEHGVMLDHALRRVSSAHTWIKRAEAERRRFQQDAAKMGSIPEEARNWLDAFRERRSSSSGATGDYLIRERAINGWDKVVQAWETLGPNSTRDQRIAAARDVQANLDEDEKFGDIQLFAGFGDEHVDDPERCLADDRATCVWRNSSGRADGRILKDYVAATVAEHNQRRFKVPAYRHPDPLRHPVFVDYGKSRWSINYSALTAAQQRRKTTQKLAQAKTDNTRAKLQQQLASTADLRSVTLGVWDGNRIVKISQRWRSKRFWRDLDLDHFGSHPSAAVSRADRLGRVAARQDPGAAVYVAKVFEQQDWNGRLQVPRRELNRLADVVYGKGADPDFGKLERLDPRARRLWERLSWFLTTSATVQPQGPWLDYVAAGLPSGIQYTKSRAGYYLNYDANHGRKGRARLCLARLPGLRVLSLDLGHRYAAACAVWQTLTIEQMTNECRQAAHPAPSNDDLFIHLRHPTHKPQKSGRKKGRPVTKTTIYRRIGPDKLPDGTDHPAPWARLERQFLIKLQGEDRPARYASQKEIDEVNQFRNFVGLEPIVDRPRVDDLHSDAVRVARLGLRRLADAARIAFAMTAAKKPISGGHEVELTTAQRIEFLQDALLLWQSLAASRRYRDDWAEKLWQSWVVEKLGGPQPAEIADDLPRSQRAASLKTARQSLRKVAEKLSDGQSPSAAELHRLWAERWQQRQTEWRRHLRWLRRLILPRRKDHQQEDRPLQRVGGLSVKRIQTIRQLYQVLKAFRMRPEPSDLRKNIPAPGDRSLASFGRRILNHLERLREQRIKQLASRVVEAALGAGRISKPPGRDRRRPQQPVDRPCHAVVIENLQHYKPEDSRLRRENRQLMDWQARNLRKYIVEGCELHGLLFVEVSPAYTSRQDSRTGAPGLRCEDVSRTALQEAARRMHASHSRPSNSSPGGSQTQFEREVCRWINEFKRVEGSSSSLSARQAVLKAFLHHQASIPTSLSTILLPRRGGELFVSADPDSPLACGLQADLNAAANIGLKALTDPDWMGAWWFVLVDRASGQPVEEQVQGCPIWLSCGPLSNSNPATIDPSDSPTAARRSNGTGAKGRARANEYWWSSLSATTLPDHKAWQPTQDYWRDIEQRVVKRLLRLLDGSEWSED